MEFILTYLNIIVVTKFVTHMDSLIIESFSWMPHLGTAGEICINKAISKEKVGFSFIHTDNPDDFSFSPNNSFKRTIFLSRKVRVKQFERMLKKFGIIILPEPLLTDLINRQINEFVKNAPKTLNDLQNYRYKTAELGLAVVSSLISKTKSLNPDINEHFLLIEKYLRASATIYEKTRELLLIYKPRRIISFNGRFACARAIFEAAKDLEVEVQYHERGATYDRYELFDKQPHDFEYLRQQIKRYWQQAIVDNEPDREEIAHDFYRRRRQGDGIGWTSFTAEQQRGLAPTKTDKLRQIVYYSSSDDEFAAAGDLVNHPIFKSQREAIKYLIGWTSMRNDCLLTIRVHPHLGQKSLEDRDWWNSLKGKNVQVIPSDSKVDTYALLDWADLVVVYNTTVGVEASYWGKPSIALGDSLYSELNCVYEPGSKKDINILLEQTDLARLPQENCLPYGYYFLRQGLVYQYYQPKDLFYGTFLGQYFGPEPGWYRFLSSMKTKLSST